MELDRAREIIRAMADGLDPISGEPLPTDSLARRTDVVSALRVALEALGRKGDSSRPMGQGRPNVGAGWTVDEERRLRDAFQAGKSIAEIAALHGRGEGGITARLVRLGLLKEDKATPSREIAVVRPQRTNNTRPSPPPAQEEDDLPS